MAIEGATFIHYNPFTCWLATYGNQIQQFEILKDAWTVQRKQALISCWIAKLATKDDNMFMISTQHPI